MANRNFFLEDFLRSLDSWGITDILLPFLLVFVIVFAVLEKTSVLGQGKKNFNVIFALILGFAVVIPHSTSSYPISFDPVDIINAALPQVSILVVAIMMLLVLIGVFAHDKVFLGLAMPGWIGFFSIISIIYIFGNAAGFWGAGGLQAFLGEDIVAIVVMILVFGLIIAFITSSKDDTKSALERGGIAFKQLFGGGKH
ncbi:hypothetical protein GOV09_04455 [Candidatus Woesearchaeota archaeon]|nr:hypothetical protein [Candidatus Woesearchaeota archaeon]